MSLSESVAADIAIVGMAGRFPGAKNIRQFWDNLRNGTESIMDQMRVMTDDDWKTWMP